MVCGILQLQARGLQDVYLTKDPDISFFRYHYFRYVNFANDIYKLHLNNQAAFGTKTQIVIPKKGHLLSKLNLHLRLPALTKIDGTYACWVDTLGYAIFNSPIELLIGGVIVDRIYPVGLDILDELRKSNYGHDRMILKSDNYRSNMYNAEKEVNLMIPLDFWFTKDYSYALPLLSMSNQDIQINFSFANFIDLINYDGVSAPASVEILESNLFAEYIMLDDIILQQFQAQKHHYIIPQMVYNGDDLIPSNQPNFSTKLNFQNPCKELLFCCIDSNSIYNNNYFNYSNFSDESALIVQASLMLDGKHRYDNFLPEYIFRDFFPNIVHSIVPSKHLYVMPFSLKPEDDQPSGSINLGRFDEVLLSLKMAPNNPSCKLYIFGIMLNSLVIENGIATFEWLNV
jgi:Major capsid protein N-terminus/Large eukaryotic DNA virus major capsid protein